MVSDTEIGAFEAKTHFSRLLERTRHGESFTITLRGRPVARLLPAGAVDAAAARESMARLRGRAASIGKVSAAEIREWIDEGRR